MKIAIMQPTYFPWMGYFDLISQSDVFVFFDSVQLVKRSWQVRNRIKLQDREHFLTIPIAKSKSRQETTIADAMFDFSENWKLKHLKTIQQAYHKSPHFKEVMPVVQKYYENELSLLADFNINIIIDISNQIGLATKFIRSSEMRDLKGTKDLLLANICKQLGGSIYISPQGSAAYIEEHTPGGEIVANGIDLFYHNYEHPSYSQLGKEFLPYMGIVDLLFNCGFEQSKKIIESGRRELIDYRSLKI